jgi:hypothetical protein
MKCEDISGNRNLRQNFTGGMKKEIIVTVDGPHTIAIQEMNIMYHSRHGAIQESTHVFIEAGYAT